MYFPVVLGSFRNSLPRQSPISLDKLLGFPNTFIVRNNEALDFLIELLESIALLQAFHVAHDS